MRSEFHTKFDDVRTTITFE